MSKKDFEPHYVAFTNNHNLVKVGCSYAGKMYYGYSKCSEEDEFDYNFGYNLAKARCDLAIMKAKVKRSEEKAQYYSYCTDLYCKMEESEYNFLSSLKKKLDEANIKVDTLLNN